MYANFSSETFSQLSNYDRGLWAEAHVAKQYLDEGCVLLAHRLRTRCAEVDLLFQNSDGVVIMVEVKLASHSAFESHRLSLKQRLRLRRAYEVILARYGRVEAHLVWVGSKGERVRYIEGFL